MPRICSYENSVNDPHKLIYLLSSPNHLNLGFFSQSRAQSLEYKNMHVGMYRAEHLVLMLPSLLPYEKLSFGVLRTTDKSRQQGIIYLFLFLNRLHSLKRRDSFVINETTVHGCPQQPLHC